MFSTAIQDVKSYDSARAEIDDEVWEKFRSSWALFGMRTDEELIRMLEDQIWVGVFELLEGC